MQKTRKKKRGEILMASLNVRAGMVEINSY